VRQLASVGGPVQAAAICFATSDQEPTDDPTVDGFGVRARRCAAAAWRAASACERTLDREVRKPRTERRPHRLHVLRVSRLVLLAER
jgi:hypothetical protein